MKNWIKEKKNAISILLVNVLVLVLLVLLDIKYPYNNFIENIIPFVLGTTVFYIFTSALFLFFVNNNVAKQWLLLSVRYLVLTIPSYLWFMAVFDVCDFLCPITLAPAFLIYAIFFIITPFYLKRKSKNT